MKKQKSRMLYIITKYKIIIISTIIGALVPIILIIRYFDYQKFVFPESFYGMLLVISFCMLLAGLIGEFIRIVIKNNPHL